MKKSKNILYNIYMSLLVFLIIFSVIFIYILDKKAAPKIIKYSEIQTKRLGIEVLKSTGTSEVNKYLKNKELYTVERNKKGDIESINFNTMLINESLVLIAKNVRKRLKDIETGKNLPKEIYEDVSNKNLKKGIVYNVPAGIIFENAFFSNIGPKIPVKIKYSGNVSLDLRTKVESYGINSALIKIYVYIEVVQNTLIPFETVDTKLSAEIPIVIKLIKGDTPNYLSGIKSSYNLPMN